MRLTTLLLLFPLLTIPLFAEEKETRLFPYGGPTEEEITNLGNPYTRAEFTRILNGVYSDEDTCRPWLKIEDEGLLLHNRLIPWLTPRNGEKTWRSPRELPPITEESRPLSDMRIAIDPGHLGGKWSAMEERDNIISDKFRVCEGVSTQIVATLLAQSLKKLGAETFITRTGDTPATPLRPHDIASRLAEQRQCEITDEIAKEAELIFLRKAEINARASLLRKFRPDLTICIHFDAGSPTLPVDKLHFIVHGSFMKHEMADNDLRSALMSRLLSQVHVEDVAIASTVAKVMGTRLNLPAYTYYPLSERVRPVKEEPYLWCRNLLANCLYPGPVLYAEPYAMLNEITARRMTLGDYEGTKVFDGVAYPSIYRQYADSLTEGIRQYYTQTRKKTLPESGK